MRINAGVQTKLVVVLLITLFASSAFAQGASDPTNEQIHRGNVKIGVGIASVAAGLFLLTPGQTRAARSEQNQNEVLAAGVVGTGFVLITWGAWQRQHKPSPQTTLGVTVGNRTAIQFVRRW
ncbi:MAG TPA: hypothetical protein VF456_23190 [Vicinamibacterales bacterium]